MGSLKTRASYLGTPEPGPPRAYLTMPDNRGIVQVIDGGCAVAQGTDAAMQAFMRRHYPDIRTIERFDPDKGFVLV